MGREYSVQCSGPGHHRTLIYHQRGYLGQPGKHCAEQASFLKGGGSGRDPRRRVRGNPYPVDPKKKELKTFTPQKKDPRIFFSRPSAGPEGAGWSPTLKRKPDAETGPIFSNKTSHLLLSADEIEVFSLIFNPIKRVFGFSLMMRPRFYANSPPPHLTWNHASVRGPGSVVSSKKWVLLVWGFRRGYE